MLLLFDCKIRQFILDEIFFENLMKAYTIYNKCTYTTFASNFRVRHEPLKCVDTQLRFPPCPILVGDP